MQNLTKAFSLWREYTINFPPGFSSLIFQCTLINFQLLAPVLFTLTLSLVTEISNSALVGSNNSEFCALPSLLQFPCGLNLQSSIAVVGFSFAFYCLPLLCCASLPCPNSPLPYQHSCHPQNTILTLEFLNLCLFLGELKLKH